MEKFTYILSEETPHQKHIFIAQLEFLFYSYVKGLNCDERKKSFFIKLIQSKGGIVSFLKKIYGENVFDSLNENITEPELRKFLQDASEIENTLYESMTIQERESWIGEGEISIAIGGRNFFHSFDISMDDMGKIEKFFSIFLLNKFIRLSSESTILVNKQYQISLIIKLIREKLFLFSAHLEHLHNMKIGAELTQNLYLLLEFAHNISSQKCAHFIDKINQIDFSDFSIENASNILSLVKNTLGIIGLKHKTQIQVRGILLGNYNTNQQENFDFRFIPENNFYFKKQEEIISSNDIFPKNGTLYETEDAFRNICIFHPNGQKVYRGDLTKDDYRKIMGTYYILDEFAGWKRVPKYAKGNIISLQEINDPYIKKTIECNKALSKFLPKDVPYLIPEYIRACALGKIERGEYIENPKLFLGNYANEYA